MLKLKDRDANSRLVYSTEVGKISSSGGKKKKETFPKSDGKIRVQSATKGRKGKGVSLIRGLPLEGPALKEFAKKLKQKCGTGGTVRNGVIEIQGDHRDFLVEHLNTLGYKAVKAGG